MPAITFTGLASGMDTDAWVKALVEDRTSTKVKPLETKQTTLTNAQKAVSTIQSSFSSLRTSMEKLTDAKYGGSFDIFAKTKTSSSESSIGSATSTSEASPGSYKLSVTQLASATKATSAGGVLSIKGSDVFASTKNGATGSFSVYVNGQKNTINVGESDTVDSVLSQIDGLDGVSASLVDGKVSITADSGSSVVLGSSNDSLNISKAFSLNRGSDGNYSSYEVLSDVTSSTKVVDALGASAKGTFTVGGAEITIDDDTTFDSLTKAINENSSSGVTAAFDSKVGQLTFTSNNNGSFNINMEKGTSDFTDLMGFTSTDSQSGVTSLANQELGQFAIYSIDGETKMSSTNSITSDVSGIKGVTFNLSGVSTAEKPSTTITVSQDSDDLLSAVKGFIEKFNSSIAAVDKETASDGNLYGDSTLNSIRNNLRTTATAKDSGNSAYKILASIGITTGKTTTDVSEVSDELQLDEDAFKKALAEDPDAVKALLIGGDGHEGVLNKLHNSVDATLKSTGYFTTKNNSIDKQVTDLKTKITSETTKIEEYQARLEAQFTAMETMIANMQKSYSSFLPSSS